MRGLSNKTLTIMFHDIVAIILSFYFSVAVRYGDFFPEPFQDKIATLKMIAVITIVQFACFYFTGLYKAIIRFSSIPDLVRIIKSSILGVPVSFFAIFFISRLQGIPRSSFIIDWLLIVLMLSSGRLAYRIFKEHTIGRHRRKDIHTLPRVLIIGAGQAGEKLYREINLNQNLRLNVVGFVDDDPKKVGKRLHEVPVLGPLDQLTNFIIKKNISKVFIAIPSASKEKIRDIVMSCTEAKVETKILPSMTDILEGNITLAKLRNIEPEDLLGRKAHQLNLEKMSEMISDRTILVTGAGGSIGSELTKQICTFNPKLLVLVEVTELFLYELEHVLSKEFPHLSIQYVVGDVRNFEKMNDVFDRYKPEIVFHAAAYKHVPLMEHNPLEAIKTNVIGTKNIATLASRHRAEKFVLISTDKAINPTNVMGSSKRIAELTCQEIQKNSETKFIIVRFGNVLGSSGSVIPAFKKQIEKGGPVLVTHPDMKRYFMSIPEASQLVIQAGSLGEGGEVMVLDMGEPVKIVDLAKEMIQLAGFEPGVDMQIQFIGLRPGEKLFEELFHENEMILPTNHPMVKIAKTSPPGDNFVNNLHYLTTLPERASSEVIKDAIKNIVPEYNYQSNGEISHKIN